MDRTEKERRKEDFESWITFMPDKIIVLKEALPFEISKNLDYSSSSLDLIERYLLDKYTREDFSKNENKYFLDQLASYLGTTCKRNWQNSFWDIELDDEQQAFFGVPILKIKESPLPPFSPYHTLTALFSRKRGNFLSTILESTKKMLERER
ncbi:hypothetical protein [Chryseolinea soli]|uniref:DUF3806 domain-containing protein n=1 Tax=Chryseolinea soli TaxID=2321403 RepID=A0A385SFG3_9BACT|nr:hypothetical protein [Chryseolinea soli]AYB29171.1 hypothetical protein D4L85_00590 [Chryseolinea soli]